MAIEYSVWGIGMYMLQIGSVVVAVETEVLFEILVYLQETELQDSQHQPQVGTHIVVL